MRRRRVSGRSTEGGTASVELVAALPLLVLALLAAAQLVLAGAALWSAGIAARAGARAAEVGGDAERTARRALPPPLREGSSVSEDGGVVVRVRVPALVPALPSLRVGTRSSLGSGDHGGG